MPESRTPSKKTPARDEVLATLRKRVTHAPRDAGVYRWKDDEGTVLYVGKAKNLRNRLRSYVAPAKQKLGPWKRSFLERIADFEVTVTTSELEALILETNLIKEYRPKYNVLMKDDKNYIYARVTVQDPYPRVEAARRIDPSDGSKYFGPMTTGGELWTVLTMLRTVFPFRTCKMEIEPCVAGSGERIAVSQQKDTTRYPLPINRLSENEKRTEIRLEVICKHKDRPTPCLDHHLGKCSAPCIGARTPEEYRKESIDGVLQFLQGNYEPVKAKLKERMDQAAVDRKFELAGKFRDHLLSVERLAGKEQVAADATGEDTDVIAVAVLSGRAHVVVMKRRNGRIVGDESYRLAGTADEAPDVLSQFIPQYYTDGFEIPDELIVSEELPDVDVIAQWLRGKRGRKVRVILPERGHKTRLLQLAEKNVREKARQEEIKWEAEKRNTEDAVQSLKEILQLPSTPHRIEGYDISHLGGTETVGSMVVLKGGKAANDLYRSFTIRTMKEGEVDDYRALKEVLTRRLRHIVDDLSLQEEECGKQGITFGKARKAEQKAIEKIFAEHPEEFVVQNVRYPDFLVARKDKQIISFGRFFPHKDSALREIKSIWVSPEYRGRKIGRCIIRKLLRTVKKGKVYATIPPTLEEYYADFGFRYVVKPPAALQGVLDEREKAHGLMPTMVVMWEAKDHKLDPSLSARPDLLVIDGGKGQLSTAVEVLQSFQLDLPVIGLAKREEEVFVPGNPVPVPFPPDAPAKFLLQRLRDEAHRFANRHREMRGTKHAIASALDDVPGIGEKTKRSLLKRFKTVDGIRSASDDQLREVLTPLQVQQVRKCL